MKNDRARIIASIRSNFAAFGVSTDHMTDAELEASIVQIVGLLGLCGAGFQEMTDALVAFNQKTGVTAEQFAELHRQLQNAERNGTPA